MASDSQTDGARTQKGRKIATFMNFRIFINILTGITEQQEIYSEKRYSKTIHSFEFIKKFPRHA